MLLWITASYRPPPANPCHECTATEEACRVARREVHLKWIRGLALATITGLVFAATRMMGHP